MSTLDTKTFMDIFEELSDKYPKVPSHLIMSIIEDRRAIALSEAKEEVELDVRFLAREYED